MNPNKSIFRPWDNHSNQNDGFTHRLIRWKKRKFFRMKLIKNEQKKTLEIQYFHL